VAYSGNRLLTRVNEEPVSILEQFGEPKLESVGPLINILDSTPIHKLIIMGSTPRKLKALRWQLNQQVGTQVTLTSSALVGQLEVLPKGGGKATGVRTLVKDLGVPLENVMAIGDAENDIEMLKMVGLGVAMGNADETVKAAAKEVVSTNNADGVAQAILKFVLPKEEPKPEPAVEKEASTSTESTTTPDAASAKTADEPKSETKPEASPESSKPEGSSE
jgi:Cof subfamily protein (haloacid dehalogenase superfamily)